MKFVTLKENEFLSFSKNSTQTSFFQNPYWGEVKKDNGWESHYVGLKEGKKVVAASLLLSKNISFFGKMFYAPRGFLLDYSNYQLLEEFTKGIKEYLKKESALFLKINPYIDYQQRDVDGNIVEDTSNDELMKQLKKLGYRHNGFYIDQDKKTDLEPRWISVLDIKDKTIDELFKNMRSGTRWGINNSKKNCLTIIEADETNLKEFKDLMKHTAERRDFIDRPLSYYENMFKVLKKENLVKVLLAEINFQDLKKSTEEDLKKNKDRLKKLSDITRNKGQRRELESEQENLRNKIKLLEDTIKENGVKKIIAGGWYMLYGREVVYLFGASYKSFMRYNSQYLLQYEMIDYALKNGYDAFNFYGIDGNFSKKSKNFGLFDFKRGFNACVHELVGEFDLVISPVKYNLYKIFFKGYKKVKSIFQK